MQSFADAFDEFMAHWRQLEFFSAHEDLELLWKSRGSKNDAVRGMIQLCAVFVHIQNGRRAGAGSLLNKSKALLAAHLVDSPCLAQLFSQTGLLLADEVLELHSIPALFDAGLETELRCITATQAPEGE
jgi:predicted metal-dependent hydrolase